MFEALVTMFRAFQEEPKSELEVGISLRSAGKQFVPREIAILLGENLSKLRDVVSIPMVEYSDVFFPGDVRVRTRYGCPPETIIKTKICGIHARCTQKRHFNFHFTLKNEIPTDTPVNMVPELVRLQQVWEFRYKSAFSYFLKKVKTGTSEALACKEEDEKFEFEIEVIRNSDYLLHHSHEEMADSLISKALGPIRESPEEDLTLELNIIPKSLKLLEPQRAKRKYISKKQLKIPKEKVPKDAKPKKEKTKEPKPPKEPKVKKEKIKEPKPKKEPKVKKEPKKKYVKRQKTKACNDCNDEKEDKSENNEENNDNNEENNEENNDNNIDNDTRNNDDNNISDNNNDDNNNNETNEEES